MSIHPSSGMVRRSTRRERNWSEDLNSNPSAFTTLDPRIDETVDDGKTWFCEDEYRYPLKDTLVDPWEQCYGIVDEFDEDLIRGLKDEISNLLVVASLFLAIVTAFVIESAKWLTVEPAERSAELLSLVVSLLNATNATERTVPQPPPFILDRDVVTINQLWFLSMTQSLAAVVLGTLCLQWLSAFTRKSKIKTHDKALALRQMRYEGLIGWGVPRVPAILLLNVQAALVLFAIGLLWFLWSTNKDVAFPVAIVSGVTILYLVLTTMLPLLQSIAAWTFPKTLAIPQCPFKSPISFIIHRFAVLLAISGSFLIQWFVGSGGRKRIYAWRQEQIPLLTDTLWENYDELWRRKREQRGPRANTEESDAQYSYYLARGLAAVMSALIAKPSAVHIVHNCLQDIHGSKAQAKTFKKLFKQNFTKDEEELLATGAIGGEDMYTFRKDFLSAHVLQYFVNHNEKLHKTVMKHRVELYIRVNNTASKYRVEVGNTIRCPIISPQDAASLAMGTRRQLLESVKNIMSRRPTCSDELRGVRAVMRSIDPQTKVSARFFNTVQDLAKELNVWRPSQRDATDFKQTMQSIVVRFPQVREDLEDIYEGDPSKLESDYSQNGAPKFEHYHVQDQEDLEWDGKGSARPESHPLVMFEGRKHQRRESENV